MTTQVYNLDGPKEFPFPYPVRAAAQLTVEIVPGSVVSPGDYEVVGVGPTSTQVTVRYPNAPTTGGLQLKISRYVAPERVTVIDDPSDITTVNLNAEFNNIYEALIDFEEFILNLVQQMLDDFQNDVLDPALAEINQARDDAIAAKDAAEAAQQGAEEAEQGATNAWDAFQDRYWGAYPTDPSVSPVGNPPTAGDLYWNTTVNQWRAWDANQGAWVSVTSAVPTYYDRRNYIATEGQTTFEATYDAGYVQVWVNGLLLPPSDYEASTGTNVVLDEGVVAGTEVSIVGLGAVVIGVLDGDNAMVTTLTGNQLLPDALNDRVIQRPDLPALRALTGMQEGQAAQITTTGRAGLLRWNSSNLKAECDADPQMGIYVPPTGQDGSAGAWVRQFGQAAMMIPTVEARWFGLRANGVDDAPAIKAARDFLAPITTGRLAGGFVELPAGEILIGSTIAHLRQGVVYRGRGISEPGLGGTVIRCADSMAGLDAFVFKDSPRGGLTDLVLLGNNDFKPNRAVFFDNELATTELAGNSRNRLERVTIGRVTPGLGSPEAVGFLRGIEFGGENGNNDEFILSNVSIYNCDEYGIRLPFIQSIWGSLSNVLCANCGTGISSRSGFSAYNLTFNRCGIDMDFNTGDYNIFGYNSEHASQALKFTGAGGVSIYGGKLLITDAMDATPLWADIALSGGGYLNLMGLNVSKAASSTTDPVIQVRRLSGVGQAAKVKIQSQIYNGDSDAGYIFTNLATNWATDQALWVEVTNGTYNRRQLITGTAAAGSYQLEPDVLYFPPGSGASPSVTTKGDTNTGIYFSDEGEVAVSSNGTTKAIFSASGLRLIGLPTSPAGLPAGQLWMDTADGRTIKAADGAS